MDEAGDGATQIQERMELDRRLGRAKGGPGKHGQPEIDGGGIQRIHRVGELHPELVLGIPWLGDPDEGVGELCVDAPVARFVRIGQRRAADSRTPPQVIELAGVGRQTGFDVPQTLAERELRKGHAAELLRTGEPLEAMLAPVSVDDAMKRLPRGMIHHLRQEQFADVPASLQAEIRWKGADVGCGDSSRGQVDISRTTHPDCSLKSQTQG